MATAKLRRPQEGQDQIEEMAERFARDIDRRASTMTPEARAKADAETKKIADDVRRRTR
jgi:hypothetical protein